MTQNTLIEHFRTTRDMPRGVEIRIALARKGLTGEVIANHRERDVRLFGCLAATSRKAEKLCREWIAECENMGEVILQAYERQHGDRPVPKKG